MKFKPGDKIIANWPNMIEGPGIVITAKRKNEIEIRIIKTETSICKWSYAQDLSIDPKHVRHCRSRNLSLI